MTTAGRAPPDPVAILCDHRRLGVYSLVFGPQSTPHANSLFSGHEEGWTVEWSLESHRPKRSWKSHEETVLWTGAACLAEDVYLLTQGREGLLKAWLFSNDKWEIQAEIPCASMLYCNSSLSESESKLTMATPSDTQSTVDLHSLTLSGNSPSLKVCRISSLQPGSEKQFGMCMKMQFCNLNKTHSRLLVGYESGHVVLWDTVQGILLSELKLFEDPVMCLTAWTSTLNGEESVKGCCGSTSTTMMSFAVLDDILVNNSSVEVTNAGFSDASSRSDSKIFVTGGWDNAGRVFSAKTLKPLVVLTYHQKGIGAVTFSQDNFLAIGCRAGYVTVWNVYKK